MRSLIAHYTPKHHPTNDSPLTGRQTEILRLVGLGLSNDEIQQQLVISRSTLKTHMSAILARLQARDRAQLVIAAYELGLVGR